MNAHLAGRVRGKQFTADCSVRGCMAQSTQLIAGLSAVDQFLITARHGFVFDQRVDVFGKLSGFGHAPYRFPPAARLRRLDLSNAPDNVRGSRNAASSSRSAVALV